MAKYKRIPRNVAMSFETLNSEIFQKLSHRAKIGYLFMLREQDRPRFRERWNVVKNEPILAFEMPFDYLHSRKIMHQSSFGRAIEELEKKKFIEVKYRGNAKGASKVASLYNIIKNESKPPFVALPYTLIDSKEFQSLSWTAMIVYVYIRRMINPKKNKNPYSTILHRTYITKSMSSRTFYKALDELKDKKFIKVEFNKNAEYRHRNVYTLIGKHRRIYYNV